MARQAQLFFHEVVDMFTEYIHQGSVCFKIARALTINGLRTGLFVSPHISCFRERMQIDNKLIPENLFTHYYDQVVRKCIELRVPATEFELLFLMSALYFRDAGCSAVVLEVSVVVS